MPQINRCERELQINFNVYTLVKH